MFMTFRLFAMFSPFSFSPRPFLSGHMLWSTSVQPPDGSQVTKAFVYWQLWRRHAIGWCCCCPWCAKHAGGIGSTCILGAVWRYHFSWYLESCEYMMDIGSEQGLWDVTGKTRVVGPYPPTKNQLELQIIFCRFIDTPVHTNSTQYCELPKLSNAITAPDRIMEKRTGFNLQAPPVYDRKVPNLFFPIIIVSIFFP